MLFSLFLLFCGVLLAWLGGTLFVGGCVTLAAWARWPASVIGATVAAFGTSAPELLVAAQASASGVPQISLGDVLGSNVVNIALILAVVLASSGLKTQKDGAAQDWAWALAAPFLLGAVLADGWFSRLDALALLGAFSVWLLLVIRRARSHAAHSRPMDAEMPAAFSLKVLLEVAGGLAVLIGAAQFMVRGGTGVAAALGMSPFVIGAVVVAVATGTPELATTIISRMRGHDAIGLGNILGSNIFNVLFIASFAALMRPYSVRLPEVLLSLLAGVAATLMLWPGRSGMLARWRGMVLLVMYLAYVLLTLQGGGSSHG